MVNPALQVGLQASNWSRIERTLGYRLNNTTLVGVYSTLTTKPTLSSMQFMCQKEHSGGTGTSWFRQLCRQCPESISPILTNISLHVFALRN